MSRSYLIIKLNPSINTLSHPDIKTVRPEGKSIGIKECRELISWAQLKPYQHDEKVAFVLEAHRLTNEAQNSLLKLLEEPPQKTHLIMLTNRTQSLLPTIISRCQIIRWPMLSQHPLADVIDPFIEDKMEDRPDDATITPIQEILSETQVSKAFHRIGRFTTKYERNRIVDLIERHIFRLHTSAKEDPTETLEKIDLLEQTRSRIQRGANLKLALENLILESRYTGK